MSQGIINFPKIVKALDYHLFDNDRECLQSFGIKVKCCEIGWSKRHGCYICLFYLGDLKTKENQKFLNKIKRDEF